MDGGMWRWLWLILAWPVAAATEDDVARAVQQLGAAKHADREQAQQFLWQAGEAARPALEEAARSSDPEIKQRARALLQDIQWGIRPGTPPQLRVFVQQFHEAEDDEGRQAAVNGLLALGAEAEPALAALAQSVPSLERRAAIFMPAWEQMFGAAAALEGNGEIAEADLNTIVEGMRKYALLLPEDITAPTLVIPRLDRLGKTKAADEIFARTLAAQRQLIERAPASADAHNNIAWLCAVARRQLDEALGWSQKANELATNNPAYLDTLAEIYFQKGDRAKALELIEQAIALDPDSGYLQQQRARFKDGKPTDPVPDTELFGH